MKICVFDTETTSLEKPFCYNVGFILYDTEKQEILCKEEYCIEQIWHNLPLFSSAYYAEKRPLYVNRMKARKITLEKWGYVTQKMARLFKFYGIECAFAYNSSFDEKVFNFNCDWFKCINPFDSIPIIDIRGAVHTFIVDDIYKAFCDHNGYFTDAGNYSTTAETVYRYITSDTDFIESHTALDDARIESEILRWCYECGADITENYPVLKTIPRKILENWKIKKGKDVLMEFQTTKITVSKRYHTIRIE